MARKQPQPTAEIMEITPALAQNWLDESRFDNRRLDERMVARLSKEIKSGHWKMDGNAIRFDTGNDILDGQHRLFAIIRAGKPVKSLVIRGLDPEAKDTIDTGKQRTLADLLHFHGHVNNNVLGGICRLAVGYDNFQGDMTAWAKAHGGSRSQPSEILTKADSDKSIQDAVSATLNLKYTRKFLGGGTLAFCYWLFRRACIGDAWRVDTFFQALEKGENLKEGDPILTLRNTLSVRDMRAYAAKGGQKMQAYRIALCIKAWNAWRTEKRLDLLRFADKENYPVPVRVGE